MYPRKIRKHNYFKQVLINGARIMTMFLVSFSGILVVHPEMQIIKEIVKNIYIIYITVNLRERKSSELLGLVLENYVIKAV